jgi:hypothetical protein
MGSIQYPASASFRVGRIYILHSLHVRETLAASETCWRSLASRSARDYMRFSIKKRCRSLFLNGDDQGTIIPEEHSPC